MASSPTEINAVNLGKATGELLKFWIDEANENITQKSQRLTKTGKVAELRRKLAVYHNIDLSATPTLSEAVGALTIDESIQKRQWAHLRALGEEWRQERAAGRPFLLKKATTLVLPDKIHHALSALPEVTAEELAVTPPLDDTLVTEEMVYAWLGSHSVGNQTTLVNLHRVKQILAKASSRGSDIAAPLVTANHTSTPTVPNDPAFSSHITVPVPALVDGSGVTRAVGSSIASTSISSPSIISNVAQTPPAPVIPSILDTCGTEILGLGQADNIRTAIMQVENDVRAENGRGGAHTSWSKMNVMITRRERLFKQLQDEFNGDKEHFFTFFTLPTAENTTKKKGKEASEKFRPFRKVVEAIPHRDKDLAAEMKKAQYQNTEGEFAEENWKARWGGHNSWEIWRSLGLEKY
ncbi:hypothetical protein C8F04DRAFT_1242222 [Mycena alexandri]|uniref:Uncharacterized protein n=1 Tax=Mycena alexandri TaxID=1745969 RepID=A0AAD6S3A0_9AGAR|nr:hypothetical protein C8F04DRAFT_1242222 [Mycena alexandri]